MQAAPGPVTGAVAAHRALTADPSLKTDWGGHGKFGAWIAQIGQGVQYSSTPSPGWVWDAKRFSPEPSSLASDARPAIEEQVTRVTDVPALSAEQFRQVFLSLAAKLRDHSGTAANWHRSVRDDCVAAGQPVSRSGRQLRDPGRAYAGGSLAGEDFARELAAAWTRNVEELCRLALMEFDDAEKLALRRWAGGGLLESGPGASRA